MHVLDPLCSKCSCLSRLCELGLEACNACVQGRIGGDFDDGNDGLVDALVAGLPHLVSLEMETFHLLDLARCAKGGCLCVQQAVTAVGCWVLPGMYRFSHATGIVCRVCAADVLPCCSHGPKCGLFSVLVSGGSIRASGICVALAERYSNKFLGAAELREAELAGGAAALAGLCRLPLKGDASTEPALRRPGVRYVYDP
jgi:hypothetical protein